MILLFGGTSETAPLADMLAEAGYDVLVSTATPIALNTGGHRRVRRRIGRLNTAAMVELIQTENVRAVVDAAHPYAEQLRATIAEACKTAHTRLLRYQRPSVAIPDVKEIKWAADHRAAAALACQPAARVLLTIGSKNIVPYVKMADKKQAVLFARVLPESESLGACRMAGLPPAQVIGMRGPFSREDNLNLLNRYGIDVLVTKESGVAGGLEEKIVAALEKKCRVVVLQRPVEVGGALCRSFDEVVTHLSRFQNVPYLTVSGK